MKRFLNLNSYFKVSVISQDILGIVRFQIFYEGLKKSPSFLKFAITNLKNCEIRLHSVAILRKPELYQKICCEIVFEMINVNSRRKQKDFDPIVPSIASFVFGRLLRKLTNISKFAEAQSFELI